MFDRPPHSPATAQTKTAAIVAPKPAPTHDLPGSAPDVNDLIEQVSLLMLREPRPVYQRKG